MIGNELNQEGLVILDIPVPTKTGIHMGSRLFSVRQKINNIDSNSTSDTVIIATTGMGSFGFRTTNTNYSWDKDTTFISTVFYFNSSGLFEMLR
jgi:hypothetical protein